MRTTEAFPNALKRMDSYRLYKCRQGGGKEMSLNKIANLTAFCSGQYTYAIGKADSRLWRVLRAKPLDTAPLTAKRQSELFYFKLGFVKGVNGHKNAG